MIAIALSYVVLALLLDADVPGFRKHYFKTDDVVFENRGEVIEAKPMFQGKGGKKVALLEKDTTHAVYAIYYGTDRVRAEGDVVNSRPSTVLLLVALCVAWGAIIALFVLAVARPLRSCIAPVVMFSALFASVVLTLWAFFSPIITIIRPGVPRAYTESRNETLNVGVCRVSVPFKHKAGQVEVPPMRGTIFEQRADPARHFILQRVEPLRQAAFEEEIRSAAEVASRREALVFVHGYNVTFEDAAMRAAQLTHDLDFYGLTAFYSWPSNGNVVAYTWDETSVDTATEHFQTYLKLLATAGELTSIHIIAHSMGSRCAMAAMSDKLAIGKCNIDQFVLCAPDVDAVKFKGMVPELAKKVDRFTLYASSKDKALQGSHFAHRYPRAGDSGAGIIVIKGVESVDATNVDTDWLGHSYYGSSPRLVDDLKLLVNDRVPASDKRRGLQSVKIGVTLGFWQFAPN